MARTDSSQKVNQALDKLGASVEAVAAVVYPQGGAGAKAVLDPVIALLAFVYTQGQEIAKIDALRKATAAVDPMMQQIAQDFSDIAFLARNDQEGERQKAVQTARLNSEQDRTAANFDTWRVAARLLNQDLVAPQDQVFKTMGEAHHELTVALQDKIHSFKDAEAAIGRLATQAQALYNLAQGFQKLASKPSGTQ